MPVSASVSDQIQDFTLPRSQAAGQRIGLNGIPAPRSGVRLADARPDLRLAPDGCG